VQINRLTQEIQFIIEIDRLKQVMRQTLLIDGSRRENSAEHSWHLAVAAPSTIQGALAYGITHLTDNLYFFIYIEIFSPTLSTLSKQ
jgi:HD domain